MMDLSITKDRQEANLLQEYLLSQGQAALWFHYKLAPKSAAYNLAGAVAVPDNTDLEALRRAFQKLAERHPMLRTLFASQHGEPLQHIYSSVEIDFQVEDASQWDSVKFEHRLVEEIYRPFDLELGPTWRVVVFQRAPLYTEDNRNGHPKDSLVLLVLHHIIVDLWSIAIIMSEVTALYRQEITGSPAKLKPLRSSYADHVKKEVERLARPQAEASWNYWHAIIPGELSALSLPLDRPRPPISSGQGADHALLLDKKLADELGALAEKYHIPIHTILLSAFQILLHRYSGQNDILVGFPKARRSPSTVRVVGYFVNQMVVRANFSKDPGFIDFLKGIQKSLDEGSRHDWYPFSLLVQHLQPDRDLSLSPLIQAVFSWQQAPHLISRKDPGRLILGQADQSILFDDLHIHSVHLPQHVSPFDLMMLATEVSEGIAVSIEYSTDLFEASTIARMAESYRTLLESIATSPARPVSELNILPNTERKKLIDTWNITAAPYRTPACLHQLFEGQAARTPNTLAVTNGEKQLTYRQLNRRANQLAHYLQSQGVGPDSLVGVFLEPSVQMVIALLGILKAGGAYLPLDPTNPGERLAFMLADACPLLLISERALLPRLPDFPGALFLMDADEGRLRAQSQANPSSALTPDHLAYVIYTSGSTGQPKGVALAHRGVVNLLGDFQRRQAIQPGDACSWWTNPGFDVSVYEIFSPLLAGGRLQVIPQNLRLDVSKLLDWLDAHHIRSAYLPPFFLEDFTAWLERHPGASSLRRLLVGVEPISDALLTHIHALLPTVSIINGYGPTEATICSTLYLVERAQPHTGNTPIGRPVANTQIYVLDRALRPVPIGVVGELYIGGVGLARGYLNQPELTAQRFIPSPFRFGARLYRTGDLARYLPDGNLVFVGRSDSQVKLHGMRIELGEIEAVLARHPRVKRAAVMLHEQPSGGKRLVAYTMGSLGQSPSPEELHRFLEERLPHAMVPSAFVVMDSLPLTTNGKVDRKALPIPQDLQAKGGNARRLPQTDVEQILVSIWQQVLGLDSVGVDDNFFELGGDSIMSLQIVGRAAEAGIHLKPQDIFQAPTVAGLVALADRMVPARKPLQQEDSDEVIPLTPIQHWFFEQKFPDPDHWNQSLMFTTSRPLDPLHLCSAVSALLEHHDVLRLHFVHGPTGWQQTWLETDEEVPFEVIDLSGLSRLQQADAIEQQVAKYQRSLNLASGPLIRVVYLDLGADLPGRLLIIIHHLAVDGVSWRILLEDLDSAYRQREHGQAIRLPTKTTAFQAWARRLAGFSELADLKGEADYWLRIADIIQVWLPEGPLIPDRPLDGLNTEGSVGRVLVCLKPEESRALLRVVPGAYGTKIDEILLTALARAFHRWTGGEALWIDLEAHGREDRFDEFDLSRTIGWFTCLYPVVLKLARDADPAQAIQRIKEQLRCIPHHGLGFGLLRYFSPDPALGFRLKAIPPAPVSFNYLGQLPQPGIGSLVSGLAPEPIGAQRCPEAKRAHLIEIDAAVIDGKLQVDWSYGIRVHSQQAIERLSNLFIEELRHLIDHCLSLEAAQYTPSDFPGASLSQSELYAILQILSRSKVSTFKRNLQAIYPLSPMQQGMLFHTLYTPETGVYFQQTTFTVRGRFDSAVFEKAWQQALKRHTILRTSFVWQGLDRMLQVVHKEVEAQIAFQDWRKIPVTEQQARLERLLVADRRRGFDLSVPPLLQLLIIQTAEDTYHFVFNHHHALLDGWSISLLFKEIFTFYQAFARGEDLTLPQARPYQDYIVWLQTRNLVKAEVFWRKELNGFIPVSLPHLKPLLSPPTGASHPAEQDESLSIHTTAALRALARQGHLTLSTLIQGALAILWSRYLQCDEVLFGVTVSGRPSELPDSMNMLGLFINTLPLRVRIPYQACLVEWLQGLQEKTSLIQQYNYAPLAQIQTWSGAPRNLPLFDALLVFENYPSQIPIGGQVNSLQIADVRSIEQTTYPLTVAVTPGRQINLRMLYDPARFEPEVVGYLLRHLRDLLEKMITNPGQSLSALCREFQFKGDGIFESRTEKAEFVSPRATFIPPCKQDVVSPSQKEVLPRGDENAVLNAPLEKYLIHQWENLLKTDQIEVHDNFFQLGGDSLVGAICISQLQNAMHETIPLAAIFEAPTIFELARYLEQKYPDGVARLLGIPISISGLVEEAIQPAALVPIQPRGGKAPLFCIHPAGGIVFPYYTLAPYLGKDQPLYGIQDPSLYEVQMVPMSIQAMASSYLEAIKKVQPEGPYHLLGWSAGGEVAFEMAQQLSRQGQLVASLIMLDTPAPLPSKAVHSQHLLKNCMQRFFAWATGLSDRFQSVVRAIKPITSYIRSGLFLLAESAKQGGTPSDGKLAFRDLLGWAGLDTWRTNLLKEADVASTISQESSLLLVKMPDIRRILRLVREHRRLALRYKAETYPGRIVLFYAVHSGLKKSAMSDPTMGWRTLAKNGVEVHTIQANHVALLAKPHIETLAKEISDCLEKAA